MATSSSVVLIPDAYDKLMSAKHNVSQTLAKVLRWADFLHGLAKRVLDSPVDANAGEAEQTGDLK